MKNFSRVFNCPKANERLISNTEDVMNETIVALGRCLKHIQLTYNVKAENNLPYNSNILTITTMSTKPKGMPETET